MSEIDDCWKKC